MSTDNFNNTVAQPYTRLYTSACRIMEEMHPFTDVDFDLVALARLVGTNRTQLSTAINQIAHTSFSNWLAEYRVNYLIVMIGSRWEVTINELYPSAGFATRSTFYRQFRKVTGLTPKQYMNKKSQASSQQIIHT